MNRQPGHGFSLVEVAVTSAVLGTAAVMLSAALSTSNAQKHTARRQAFARTLVIRQLEHIQARIDDSIRPGNTVDIDGGDPQLRLTDLRTAARRVTFVAGAAAAGQGPQFQTSPLEAIENVANLEIPQASAFHISTVLTAEERDRLTAENLRVRAFACAATVPSVQIDGATAVSPRGGWTGNLHDLDLIMFQVVVQDVDDPQVRFYSLSRLCRVPSRFLFPPLDAGGPPRGKF